MNQNFESIIRNIRSRLTGDFEADKQMLITTMRQYQGHKLEKEISRECGRILYEIAPEDAKRAAEAAVNADADPNLQILDQTFELISAGKPQEAFDTIIPLCQKLYEAQSRGMFADDAVNRYFDLDSLVQHLMAEETLSPGQDQRDVPLPFARAYSLCAAALFDLSRHEEARTWLQRALEWNPFQPLYYFEMAENYKVEGNLKQAEIWQDKAYSYVADAQTMARWYRSKGFCSIERGDHELAAAEYVFSNAFEPTRMAASELYFISERFGKDYSGMDFDKAIAILKRNKVPIGPSDTATGALASGFKLALQHEELEAARDCLADLYSLTWNQELVKILDSLDEEIGGGCERPISMPQEYQKLRSMPDDPEGQITFATETSQSIAIVHFRPIPKDGYVMDPCNPQAVIDGIHRDHDDDQGLIEVNTFRTPSGTQGVYSIIKTRMQPSGVQYSLTLHLIGGPDSIEVQGFFEEQGTTGMRDAIGLEMARRNGLVQSGLEGWMRDPYDPNHIRGALMNLSEVRDLDAQFPEHPLSLCRALVGYIQENA